MSEHRPPGLWANCDKCGDLQPEDVFVFRVGCGWVCHSCDPGETMALFGMTIASESGKIAWNQAGEFECVECEANSRRTAAVLSEDNQSSNEDWVWLAVCDTCLLARIALEITPTKEPP